MAYEKQNFEDGAVLKASHLNHIEDGIEAVESEVTELARVGGVIAENVSDHESRIVTLEEGGNGGGAKLYKHRIYVGCSDYNNCPYASAIIEFLSGDSTPLTTLAEVRAVMTSAKTCEISRTGSVYLQDSTEGEREVTRINIYNDNVNMEYVTAYTVPKAVSGVEFNGDVCTVSDNVWEV